MDPRRFRVLSHGSVNGKDGQPAGNDGSIGSPMQSSSLKVRPDQAEYLMKEGIIQCYPLLGQSGCVIWITGLSGSALGKEHAVMSKAELQERQDKKKRGDDLELGPAFHSGVNEKERGMAIPFQPLIMCFSNINYYVVVPVELKKQGILEDRLQLLVNVTGAFRLGILTALVGVSCAGETEDEPYTQEDGNDLE
ncbi:hypothetical protein Taro_029333 [Colocasia esculenta]|uniref:Uncharacterized protein n=1 Tax=Colocasia esculenta TaxID=4460 RepID=A0A843VSZ2_COLES|nr:hypothetical protein [Colocasia esculenta]